MELKSRIQEILDDETILDKGACIFARQIELLAEMNEKLDDPEQVRKNAELILMYMYGPDEFDLFKRVKPLFKG